MRSARERLRGGENLSYYPYYWRRPQYLTYYYPQGWQPQTYWNYAWPQNWQYSQPPIYQQQQNWTPQQTGVGTDLLGILGFGLFRWYALKGLMER